MPTVSIDGDSKVYELDENEILFDGLDKQGKELPHGCLAGSCGSCRIIVESGEENLSKVSYIEENTIEAIKEEYNVKKGEGFLNGKIIRLSCRAKITQGDVKIKILD